MQYNWVKPYEQFIKRRVVKDILVKPPFDAEKYERHRKAMLDKINQLFDNGEENENYGNLSGKN